MNRWQASISESHLELDGLVDEYTTNSCWLPGSVKKVIRDIKLMIVPQNNPYQV